MTSHTDGRWIPRAARCLSLVAACLILSAPLSAQERKPKAVLKRHEEAVKSLCFSPDGKTLASGGDDHAIKLWDVATGRNTTTQKKGDFLWSTAAFSPDGKLLATGGWLDTVELWDFRLVKGTVLLDKGEPCPETLVVFSPDGKHLVSGGICRGEMILYDVAARKKKAALVTNKGFNPEGVLAMTFTPDGKTVISVGRPGEIRTWDSSTGKLVRKVRLEMGEFAYAAVFSPDARTGAYAMFTDDEDATARDIILWSVATGKTRTRIKGVKEPVLCLAFSPDGKTLAAGYSGGAVKLWDVARGRALATLTGHAESVRIVDPENWTTS